MSLSKEERKRLGDLVEKIRKANEEEIITACSMLLGNKQDPASSFPLSRLREARKGYFISGGCLA